MNVFDCCSSFPEGESPNLICEFVINLSQPTSEVRLIKRLKHLESLPQMEAHMPQIHQDLENLLKSNFSTSIKIYKFVIFLTILFMLCVPGFIVLMAVFKLPEAAIPVFAVGWISGCIMFIIQWNHRNHHKECIKYISEWCENDYKNKYESNDLFKNNNIKLCVIYPIQVGQGKGQRKYCSISLTKNFIQTPVHAPIYWPQGTKIVIQNGNTVKSQDDNNSISDEGNLNVTQEGEPFIKNKVTLPQYTNV